MSKIVTLKDLSNVINNDVLHELYMARDLTLSDVTNEDKKNLELLYKKEKQEHNELLSTIKKIPNMSTELLKIIENKIEKHVDNNTQIIAYFDEKLFKCGVIDGIILMLESKKKLSASKRVLGC